MDLHCLAFGAHPDDVELFCGGTLIKLAADGYRTGVVDLTKGELGTRGTPELRMQESKHAAELMQLSMRENAEIGDGHILNDQTNRLKVISILRQWRPRIVLLPYWEDRHPDHVRASNLLTEACYYSGLAKIESGQQAFRPPVQLYYFYHTVAEPSFVVDVSTHWSAKINAIKAHASQFYQPDSEEPETYISSKAFWDSIETRGRYFGFKAGVAYAEPFYFKSMLKIDNLMEIFA